MYKAALVTGCAGFIGSNLCERLIDLGWTVIGIDNLSSGRMSNINPLIEKYPERFLFYRGDTTDRDKLRWAFDYLAPDIVFSLAAIPKVSYSVDRPLETNDANVVGALNILEYSRLFNIERVIFASSSSVYGGSLILPTPEDAPLSPKSPYALQKYIGEQYCKLYSSLYGIDTVSARFFNVFGKNQYGDSPYASAVSAFCKSLKNKVPAVIFGNGTQFRDFTPVNLVVDFLIKAAEYPGKLNGGVFNVGCGEKTTINELANIMGITDIIYKEERAGDVPCSQADISKAKTILEYNPKIDLQKELQKTIKWYMENE